MPDDLQKPTNTYENPYDLLDIMYRRAVDLRLENLKYRMIANQLKVQEVTVREWFAKKGKCYAAYKWKEKQKKKEAKLLFKSLDEEIKDAAVEAFVTIRNAMRKGNLGAAYKILDMAGFEPVHKFKDETDRSKELILLEKIIDDDERTRKALQSKQQTC